jgi:hypothetical protein
MPRTTIAAAAAEELARHRAMSAQELGRVVAARGLTRARNPTQAVSRALAANPDFRRLGDDRWVVPAHLLEGGTLTHRLTALEAGSDAVALLPDLAPLASLARVGLLAPDGQLLSFLWDADARDATGLDTDVALEGPDGWLPDTPGTLLHVRLTGSLLRVARGPAPKPASKLTVRRLVESCRARLPARADQGWVVVPHVVSLEEFMLETLVDEPDLLAQPLPPLGEALTAAGLEVHGDWVGPAGTDWERVDDLMAYGDDWDGLPTDDVEIEDGSDDMTDAATDERMAEALGLDEEEVEGLRIVLGAYELSKRIGAIEDAGTNASLATMFAFPGIARMLSLTAWRDPELESFVAPIARAARGPDAAGPRLVLGALAEVRDDVAAAERAFRSALDADPGHPFALVEVARYEIDRGQYADALRHLRRAGVPPGDPERIWLETLVAPAGPKVGRNERCPCGSGRKFKVCHMGQPGAQAAVQPATMLLHKLGVWLTQPDVELIKAAVSRAAGADGDDAAAAAGPLVADVVLFDRGQLERFLDVRGVLLPEAERTLGRTWLASRRSLYEVRSVNPGNGLTVRDLRSDGDSVDVPDRSLSRQAEPLDLICMRLLPDGSGGVVATDGIGVPRVQRRHVLDLLEAAEGLALLRWVTAPAPRPRLQNTEGEPLRLVTVDYRVPDPPAAMVALGRKLRAEDDGRFVETVTRHGEDWIRGSITIEGDRATIDANSTKRAARLERSLLRAAPGATLIRREDRAIDDALEAARARPSGAEALDPAEHPEVARALDEFIQRMEAGWVGEPIPALGGLTPRQALADDAVRPELEALLDDMTWEHRRAGRPGLMDPDRIRALLGMTAGR